MTFSRMHVVRRSLFSAILLCAGGAGCGEVTETEDPDSDPTVPTVDPTDETAPAITDTQPAASASAVDQGEQIYVTFSESMDQASVEAAYVSTDLPADQVAFEWSPDGTVLTIIPNDPLAYAEGLGTDPSVVTPKTYAIRIGADATDLAGNPLGAPMDLSFSTRRRLLGLFGLDTALTRVTLASTSYAMSEIMVGDNMNKSSYRSYLTFDLAALPADAEIERAQFQGLQIAPTGAPYGMGGVNVQHVTYTGTLAYALNATNATSQPGIMSNDATLENKIIDVTPQVIDDVDNRVERNHRSQYRLQIDVATNNDDITDRAQFSKSSFVLGAIYVVD